MPALLELSLPNLTQDDVPMKTTFLDFEQPIAELEGKIEELRTMQEESGVDISEEVERLAEKAARCPMIFMAS